MDNKTTTIDNYQERAIRTAPSVEMMQQQGLRIGTYISVNLVHAVLGLSGEVGELAEGGGDIEYFIKELGDITWYSGFLCDVMGWKLTDLIHENEANGGHPSVVFLVDLVIETGKITDALKRHIYYGTDLDSNRIRKALAAVLWAITDWCIVTDTDFNLILQTNIDKLQKRYPEKFSELDAVERKDEDEEA